VVAVPTCQFLPVAATSCHGLPCRSPHEVPTLARLCGMKRRLFGTIQRLPSKRYRAYCGRERRIYAQGTFATKPDAGRGTWVDPHRAHEPLQKYAAPG
jgi:hypothetical protein